MIHRGLLVFLSIVCFSVLINVSAIAQDGTSVIKVIKDDGAIKSLEIPKQSPPVADKQSISTEELLMQMESAMTKDTVEKDNVKKNQEEDVLIEDEISEDQEIFIPKMTDDPVPKDAVPIFESGHEPKNLEQAKTKSKDIKSDVVKKVEKNKTSKKILKKSGKDIKKKKIYKKTVAKKRVITNSYKKTNALPPLPSIKPAKPVVSEHYYRDIDYTNLPNGVVITSDVARRIALEYAPPSRSVTVYENRKYKDRIVYQVTFKTDNGMHDILIDAQNGDVLKK